MKKSFFYTISLFSILLLLLIPTNNKAQPVAPEELEKAFKQLETRREVVFSFHTIDRRLLQSMYSIISMEHPQNGQITAYANEAGFLEFLKYDLPFNVLTPPSQQNPINQKTATLFPGTWNTYPSYEEYLEQMQYYANTYPGLCQLDTLGQTVEGRLLLAVKISDHVSQKEAEPEVFYSSTMHGDEVTGFVLLLRLADYLLSNYATDPYIQQLVDQTEIWINPNANPDGTYAGGNSSVWGATRFNAHAVDLNRNFPDPQDGSFSFSDSWEPEILAMMHFMDAHQFTLAINYHGGSEVVNYPWDTWYTLHPDNEWFIHVSQLYADSVKKYGGNSYFSSVSPSGITNGAEWYVVEGGRQDFSTYYCNTREVTLEVSNSKMPLESMLPSFWLWNRVAMLQYMEHGQFGIYGSVSDATSGNPLAATISLPWHDADNSMVTSDSIHGDYYRPVAPGNYQVHFRCHGYNDTVVSGVVVPDFTSHIALNMAMVSGTRHITPLDTPPSLEEITWSVNETGFAVESETSLSYRAWVVDASGKTLLQRDHLMTNSGTVTLRDHLAAGIYTVHLEFENRTAIHFELLFL